MFCDKNLLAVLFINDSAYGGPILENVLKQIKAGRQFLQRRKKRKHIPSNETREQAILSFYSFLYFTSAFHLLVSKERLCLEVAEQDALTRSKVPFDCVGERESLMRETIRSIMSRFFGVSIPHMTICVRAATTIPRSVARQPLFPSAPAAVHADSLRVSSLS